MKITVDTNVLLRAVLPDEGQHKASLEALRSAEIVAISTHSLCELVWVLARSYGTTRSDIADTVRSLVGASNVIVNRPAVEAGLAILDAGGDFADGVIAFEGRWLGAETFLSFDQQAVKILEQQGTAARLLS